MIPNADPKYVQAASKAADFLDRIMRQGTKDGYLKPSIDMGTACIGGTNGAGGDASGYYFEGASVLAEVTGNATLRDRYV
jgi:hypothetical protein